MNITAQAKCERVLRWLRNEDIMTTTIGGNPAVNQAGEPIPGTTLALTPQQQKTLTTLDVPDWILAEKEDLGTELMGRYISLPRLKIVQGQSKQELKREFGESSVIMTPDNKLVTGPLDKNSPVNPKTGQPETEKIRLVPLFFYPEFLLTNPIKIATLPFIRERSTDDQSAIARRCRGPKEGRTFVCPDDPSGQLLCTYSEALNFIVALWHGEEGQFPDPCLISFRMGSWVEGANWCKVLKSMEQQRIPMYGQVFELNVSPRKKDQFDYYGFNVRSALRPNGLAEFVANPDLPDGGQGWFQYAKELHRTLKEQHSENLLRANYDDEEGVNTTADANVIQTTAVPKF